MWNAPSPPRRSHPLEALARTTRRAAWSAWALCVACGGEPAETPRAPREAAEGTDTAAAETTERADPERAAPEPASPRAGDSAAGDPAAAIAAYRAALAAFERGAEREYAEAYAETLLCFFGRRDAPREAMLRARRRPLTQNAAGALRVRLRAIELRAIRTGADEVELADFGWTGPGASAETRFHQKRVVLARLDGRWRIVVESPLSATSCGLPPAREEPPWMWTSLRAALADLIESCEGPPGSTMEDGYPGIHGSIGCDPSVALSLETECLDRFPEGAALDGCLARAEREVEAFDLERPAGE